MYIENQSCKSGTVEYMGRVYDLTNPLELFMYYLLKY